MTLDNIELVGRIEHTFNIQIPEAEANKILTIGDMYEVICRQVNADTANHCLVQLCLNRLTKLIHELYGVPREIIRPETKLEDIIPLSARRKNWEKLSASSDLRFPKLVLPYKWETVLIRTGVALVVGSLYISVLLFFLFDYSAVVLLAPVAGAGMTWLMSRALDRFRTAFPEKNMLNLSYHFKLLNRDKIRLQPLNKYDLEILSGYTDTSAIAMPIDELTREREF